jgi:hypothetical protein
MKIKIITQDEAAKMGLTKPYKPMPRGGGGNEFLIGVVGKSGGIVGGKKQPDIIQEVHRIHRKTGKRDILYERPEFRAEKKRLKINEYKEK